MTIDLGIGNLYCRKDYKNENKVFYFFKPNKDFDDNILSILQRTEELKSKLESQLELRLSDIKQYE